ncbi:hypothetical protein LDENG_00231740 [Lucifuga dentata]|nr:hypothetical protein LDENG_00231740 [Lucifuga dentata]
MDRSQYIWEGQRQLKKNTTLNLKKKKKIYLDTIQEVKKILQKMKSEGYITKKQLEYLQSDEDPRPRRFYLFQNPQESGRVEQTVQNPSWKTYCIRLW